MTCRHYFLLLLTIVNLFGCDHSPRMPVAEAGVDTSVKSVVFAFEKSAMTAEEFNLLRNAVAKAIRTILSDRL